MTKPIEKKFPVEELNQVADRESHAKEKYRPILFLHKWWARRLGSVFRTIALHSLVDESTRVFDEEQKQWRLITSDELSNPWLLYLKDVDVGGKIVLDPMMGGGTTVVEALRIGCRVFAQDLNPVAWFLVKKILDPVDINELRRAFVKLEREAGSDIKCYYKTLCPHCFEDYLQIYQLEAREAEMNVVKKLEEGIELSELIDQYWFESSTMSSYQPQKRNVFADVKYFFWIKELPCLTCGTKIPLFRGYVLARVPDRKIKAHYVICPDCNEIFVVKDPNLEVTCPSVTCKKIFNPKNDHLAKRKTYFCTNPKCRQKHVIVEAIKKVGKPNERLYAIEYYCPSCQTRGYKKPTAIDRIFYERARSELRLIWNQWVGRYLPDALIPDGMKTKEMLNYGYRYWKDIFNDRQLLCLGKLLKAILELDVDESVREFLVITFSKFLEFQNMLCDYARDKLHLYNLFKIHAFHVVLNPVENNVWGSEGGGRGTFRKELNKILKAKQYLERPFEKYIKDGKTMEKPMHVKIDVQMGDIFKINEANVLLSCGDSSRLDIPDQSVDVVITDPPYYGNVMYSELSEFFYVWLRLALKEKYVFFRRKHVPKAMEVIVNKAQGKSEREFTHGLTAIFMECHRKLKDDGIMVFTFHHQNESAWGAILQSLLESGFYITAIYPVKSESSVNPHIFRKANVRYDMVVVCKKRFEPPKRKNWDELMREIRFRIQKEIERLKSGGKQISREDVFVIAMGKCLEVYSMHHPEIYEGDRRVSIRDALLSIKAIIDS